MPFEYFVLYMCLFTFQGRSYEFLPMYEMQLIASAYKNMEGQRLDPAKHGVAVQVSRIGCVDKGPGNIPGYQLKGK